MVIVCPLMKNPLVAREFNELKDAIGEKAAYAVWSLNNGYSIDKAPNGEPSILFKDLLNKNGNDRTKAIREKAKYYSNSYRNNNGDWCDTAPKVKYYGPTMGKTTAAKVNNSLVDFDDIVREDIKKLAEKQGKTVKEVKIESGPEYEQLLIDKINEFKNNPENNNKTLVVSNAVMASHNELFDNVPVIPSKNKFVRRQVERSEDTIKTKEELTAEAEQYYDDLLARTPDLQIEDRFVSELEQSRQLSVIVDENGEPQLQSEDNNLDDNQLSNEEFSEYGRLSGLEDDKEYTADEILEAYKNMPEWETFKPLAEMVFQKCKELGIKFRTNSKINGAGVFHSDTKQAEFNLANLVSNTLLHEAIHAVTNYYIHMDTEHPEMLNDKQKVAIKELKFCYETVKKAYLSDPQKKKDYEFFGNMIFDSKYTYGFTKLSEFIAELSSPSFRITLQRFDKKFGSSIFEKLINIIAKLFGIKKTYKNVETTAYLALKTLLQNTDINANKVFTEEMIATRTITDVLSDFNNKFLSINPPSELAEKFLEDLDRLSTGRTLVGNFANIFSPNELESIHEGSLLKINIGKNYVIAKITSNIQTNDNGKQFVTFDVMDPYFAKDAEIKRNENGYLDILDSYQMFDTTSEEFFEHLEQAILDEPRLIQAVSEKMSNYVTSNMMTFDSENPNATEDERYQRSLDLKKQFLKDYVKTKMNVIINNLMSNTGRGETANIRKKFVDSLKEAVENNDLSAIDTFVTMIANDAFGISIESNVHSVIAKYIELFSDSEAIQNALTVLNDETGQSTPRLMRNLADYVWLYYNTGNLKRNIRDIIFNMLYKLNNLLHGVFKGLTRRQNREFVVKEIYQYFAARLVLDAQQDEQLVHDMKMWTKKFDILKVTLDKVVSKIKDGIDSRIAAIKSVTGSVYDEKEYNNLLSWSAQLQEIKEMPQGQDKENSERVAIEKFINNGINELAKVVLTLDHFNNSEVNLDNLPQLIRMKSLVIGFYQNIVNQYITKYIYGSNDNYFDPSTAIGMHLLLIQQRMQIIKNNYDNQLLRYTSAIIDKCADETVDIGDKERFKTNAKLWLMNKIGDGDLSFLESFVGPASSSISPVIRILDWYTRQANHIKHTEALARGLKLLALYNKCKPLWDTISPGNFMRKFCEMDENGRPTGRFRSLIKEGLFRKKRQEAIDKLRKKYKATIQDGKVLFLDESGNEDWDREKKYLDELDDVLYQLGQIRQYTPQYYKDKRSFLSKDTLLRIDTINKHIRQLQYKFTKEITVDGKKLILPDTSKLSNSDAELLKQLQEQKQNLSSFYNIIKDSNGYIVSFEKKTGDDLRMALEITNWNTFKRGKLKYYGNEQLFTKAYESIVQQFGKDSQEAKRFLYENSTVKATDEWFEKLTSESVELSDEVYELRSRRNAILRSIMVNKEGLFRDKYDFSKLNDDALAELKKIETRLDKITEHTQHSESYKDFVRTRTTGMNYGKTGDSMSFLDRELQRIQNLYPGDQRKLIELYFDKYYFTNSNGEQVPMSIFSTIVPSQEEDIDRYSPTGVFVELLSWSEYADTRWQYHSQDQILFDKTKDEYIDKEFSEFIKDKDIKAFYDELLSIMNDAWKMLPAINRTDNLLMPQRRDRSSHLITRFGLAPMRGILSNMWNINENDTNFNEELSTMPDGTVVETIPIRWVKRLDDPTAISTDIVGSVMDFYEMAVNFREKQVVAALGEAIKLQTMGGITKERHTGQSEYIENYNSMFIYGRMIKPLGSNKRKMTKMEKLITRFLQNIRSYAHTKLMAHNLVGVVKNGIDSFSSIIAEAVGGKYFDTHMMWKSMGYMAKEFFSGQLWAVGNTKTRSFTAAAMLFNGAHGSIHEMFHHHNESWFRRILSAHLCMGEYTLIDYTFTGLLTNMIYCSYKYMVNPNTGQREFMNKEKAKWEYVRAGFSKKDAIDAFKREKTTLRDAYEVINGVFTLKPEYEDAIRPKKDSTEKRSVKLETRISQAILERSAIVNGVLTEMDRSKLHSNYIGALVAQMRGWMISQQADYNRTGHDFALYSDEDKELTKKNISTLLTKMMGVNSGEYNIVEEDEDLLGQYNFTTGTVDRGCWISLLSAYKHAIGGLFGVSMLTDNERYAIRRMNACIMSVIILSLLSFGIGRSIEGDDDDTPYWLHWVKMLAYVSTVSAISERESLIGYLAFIPVVGDILNSPAIAKAWIDDLDWIYQFPIDAFKSLYVYCSGDKTYGDPANTVIKGKNSFAGYTELEKSVAMAASELPEINKLGIHNIFKNKTDEGMKAKERYYYDKIFGTNLIAYQAQWNKEPTEQKGIYGVLESTGVLKKQIKPKTSKKQKPKTSSRTVSRTSSRTSTRTRSR